MHTPSRFSEPNMLAMSFSEAGAARFSEPSCRPLRAWEMLSEYLETSSSVAEFSPLKVSAAASAIFLNPAMIWSGSWGSGGISPLGVSGPPKSVFMRSASTLACSLKADNRSEYKVQVPRCTGALTYMKNASGSSEPSAPAVVATSDDADGSFWSPAPLLSKSWRAPVRKVDDAVRIM